MMGLGTVFFLLVIGWLHPRIELKGKRGLRDAQNGSEKDQIVLHVIGVTIDQKEELVTFLSVLIELITFSHIIPAFRNDLNQSLQLSNRLHILLDTIVE